MLTEAAPAKINLNLHVTGRRPDGYHLLDSLVVFAGAHDRISAVPAETLSLVVTGPFAAGLQAGAGNLVLLAAKALSDAAGLDAGAGAAVTLEKNLPVASGIGGGSSDAAATLRLLAAVWQIAPAAVDLPAIAAKIGADVPVCLQPGAWRMRGIGDVLAPAPRIPICGLVLVNPGVMLSTQAVFRARTGAFSAAPDLPDGWSDTAAMARGLAKLTNDLEPPALELCPAVAEVLAALRATPGCLLARMSGSGATCFALFATEPDAQQAAAGLHRPGWWCWGGGLWPGPA